MDTNEKRGCGTTRKKRVGRGGTLHPCSLVIVVDGGGEDADDDDGGREYYLEPVYRAGSKDHLFPLHFPKLDPHSWDKISVETNLSVTITGRFCDDDNITSLLR